VRALTIFLDYFGNNFSRKPHANEMVQDLGIRRTCRGACLQGERIYVSI